MLFIFNHLFVGDNKIEDESEINYSELFKANTSLTVLNLSNYQQLKLQYNRSKQHNMQRSKVYCIWSQSK